MKAINEDLIIAEVLDIWPEVIPVFFKYRMSCVGCAMSPFETLSDAIRIYKISHDQFVEELNRSIGSPVQ